MLENTYLDRHAVSLPGPYLQLIILKQTHQSVFAKNL